jgi:hypothetical protein
MLGVGFLVPYASLYLTAIIINIFKTDPIETVKVIQNICLVISPFTGLFSCLRVILYNEYGINSKDMGTDDPPLYVCWLIMLA